MSHRWNFAVEQQAFGRVYRIGQTKETHLCSTIVADSIESMMMEKKQKKQEEIGGIMNDHRKRTK